MELLSYGNENAPILVIVDPPSKKAAEQNLPISLDAMNYIASVFVRQGFTANDFIILSCSPFMPEDIYASDAKQTKFLKEHRSIFLKNFAKYNPKAILTLGSIAAKQVSNKKVKITKERGMFHDYPDLTNLKVFHTYAASYIIRSPQHGPIFESDIALFKKFVDNNYSLVDTVKQNFNYSWCGDLTDWINDKPKILAFDTETTGLKFKDPKVYPFVLQLCRDENSAIMIPVRRDYFPEFERDHDKLMGQVKILLEDNRIHKLAHNIKFDYHMMKKCNIIVENWAMDTQQAAFAVDENMVNKSLAECVRRWVPEMASYSDKFDMTVDKSKMIEVDKDIILSYGCGDSLGCYKLGKVLQTELKKDERNYYLFKHVQMPALRMLADTLEDNGIYINKQKLTELGIKLAEDEKTKYNTLIAQVPGVIKRKHIDEYKGDPEKALQFTRANFVIDILFSSDGYNLKPLVFTKGTRKLGKEEKIPSVSIKDHLPYFSHIKFVEDLIDYKKLQKMRSTYVGMEYDPEEKGPTGFWKYIVDDKVYPTYRLDNTNTGRSSSQDPNGQNFPKRSVYAKDYNKIFDVQKYIDAYNEEYVVIQADYSQIELRAIACSANETAMITAFNSGRDLHSETASFFMNLSYDDFMTLDETIIDDRRYKAKSTNFGLPYGMSAEGFQEYAYTNYGLKITLEQAKIDRDKFFNKYPELLIWIEVYKQFAYQNGYVRSMHGALRRLPDIYSQDSMMRSLAERQSVNAPIQRFGSDMALIAMTRIYRDMKKNNILDSRDLIMNMYIHDAIRFVSPKRCLDENLSAIKFYMESNPLQSMFGLELPVPLIADIEVGNSFGEMKKVKNVPAIAPWWYTGD